MARYLVVGAGGIGGILSAHLNEQGHDVTTLTKNPLIADAVNAFGFRVRGDASPGTVRGKATASLPAKPGKFEFILLATQPPQVEEAAREVGTLLAEDGVVVCLQNGLCEERVAKIIDSERVVGAVVAWGASMVEPGVYDRTSGGGFQIGRLDGCYDERVSELAQVLECIGPTVTTTNLRGARWSKLAINCAISSLGTIGGDRLGALMRYRHTRRLALEIMTEATEVALAAGVRMEKVSGTLDLEWIALTQADKTSAGSPTLIAKHALLLAVGARYRRLRSSMLAAIERGRVPAIDFLNGEIVQQGKEVGVATPLNAAVREEVLRIAAGKAKSSHDLLRAFFEKTRPLMAQAAKDSAAPPATVDEPPKQPAVRPSEQTFASGPSSHAMTPPPTSDPVHVAPPKVEPAKAPMIIAMTEPLGPILEPTSTVPLDAPSVEEPSLEEPSLDEPTAAGPASLEGPVTEVEPPKAIRHDLTEIRSEDSDIDPEIKS